jgi:uncharacterized membrane protein HdeD (DUF308 family)
MQTWWMLAVRGGLGILLGLVVLLSPRVELGELVALFGSYAVLDGIWAVAWAVRSSRRPLEGWPVVLEGALSVAVGIVAIVFPFEAAAFVLVIAPWGVVTGLLEIVSALSLPERGTGHWALAGAGSWSIFLSALILILPHAVTHSLVNTVGVYALIFGALVSTAAILIRRNGPHVVAPSDDHTWTTR